MDRAELYSDMKTGAIDTRYMYFQNVDVVKRPEYIFNDIQGFITIDNKDIEGIIRKIVDSIPEEWETYYCAETIIELLTSRVQNRIH